MEEIEAKRACPAKDEVHSFSEQLVAIISRQRFALNKWKIKILKILQIYFDPSERILDVRLRPRHILR